MYSIFIGFNINSNIFQKTFSETRTVKAKNKAFACRYQLKYKGSLTVDAKKSKVKTRKDKQAYDLILAGADALAISPTNALFPAAPERCGRSEGVSGTDGGAASGAPDGLLAAEDFALPMFDGTHVSLAAQAARWACSRRLPQLRLSDVPKSVAKSAAALRAPERIAPRPAEAAARAASHLTCDGGSAGDDGDRDIGTTSWSQTTSAS